MAQQITRDVEELLAPLRRRQEAGEYVQREMEALHRLEHIATDSLTRLRTAAPRPAPATPRDVLEPLLETLRVEARDDETFNGGRESPQTRAAKDAILTAVDAMIGGANV